MKKIKIGGIIYKVENVKRLEDDNQSAWGVTQYENAHISIRDKIEKQKYYQTIIHEALHGMLHEAGVDNLANDESLVTPLGNMLYQFIVDNPKLIEKINNLPF
ncbi:hypothetical protein LB941_00930 [Ligilactobacillus sp. WILCCON 0076]|uniref:IrrE N-terminal-like domain-containing protein n=1 Tax=Ligilactobacillus ubinensis TaxID=2876789 RepID=A0A9X2JJY4_9LACO|nr:hypothetical protein [Ligilactobacillus ubinensis]MCP0885897.1 hypothetical protein [Ligilactobacillus ubinensis]